MGEHTTAERPGHDKDEEQEGAMATNITVTVNPGNPQGNKEVSCNLVVAPPKYLVAPDIIWLDPGVDYDITFHLAPANGVTNWHSTPFGNQAGSGCPATGAGACPPFTQNAGGGPNSMSIHVTGGGRSVNSYRLDFNNGYFCDPIIVVG